MKSKIFRFLLQNKFLWTLNIVYRRLVYSFDALYKGVFSYKNSAYGQITELRRNIHMIEKGISFNQRKEFAQRYILETVKLFRKLYFEKQLDLQTLQWVYSVLDEYFNIATQTDIVKKSYTIFSELKVQINDVNNTKKPFYPKLNNALDYEVLYKFTKQRKTIRFYKEEKVELEKIYKAVEIASFSPSACNRQPFRFIYIDEKQKLKQVKELAGGAKGFDFPGLFVVVGNYGAIFEERDFFIPVIDSVIATTNLINALESLEVSSVCLNWPNLPKYDKEIRKILDIKETEVVVILVGCGYMQEDKLTPYSQKKSVSQLLDVIS